LLTDGVGGFEVLVSPALDALREQLFSGGAV